MNSIRPGRIVRHRPTGDVMRVERADRERWECVRYFDDHLVFESFRANELEAVPESSPGAGEALRVCEKSPPGRDWDGLPGRMALESLVLVCGAKSKPFSETPR
jgi:hypothetical protein